MTAANVEDVFRLSPIQYPRYKYGSPSAWQRWICHRML